ncbi:MAG: hypothetical protein JO069_22780, partial [Verrucomicrobia bacterium]|nr:hypothetical protein [Verrucomicrobiota bacterium]
MGFFNWRKRKAVTPPPASLTPTTDPGAKTVDLPPAPGTGPEAEPKPQAIETEPVDVTPARLPAPESTDAETAPPEPPTEAPVQTVAAVELVPETLGEPGPVEAFAAPIPSELVEPTSSTTTTPEAAGVHRSSDAGQSPSGVEQAVVAQTGSLPAAANQTETPHPPATVRATGEDGRIRWRGGTHPPRRLHKPKPERAPGPFVQPPEAEPFYPFPDKVPSEPASDPESGAAIPPTISLRLEPILKQLPLELETPEIRALRDSDFQVELPTDMVREQLPRGRVMIAAGTFAAGLPQAQRAPFQKLDPNALLPIPLQEIFTKLPISALRRRSDQTEDQSDPIITTPFTVQAREDAARFKRQWTEAAVRALSSGGRPQPASRATAEAATATATAAAAAPTSRPAAAAASAPAVAVPVAAPGLGQKLTEAVRRAPQSIQAIFLQDDVIDLPTALQALLQLPGLQAAMLCDP